MSTNSELYVLKMDLGLKKVAPAISSSLDQLSEIRTVLGVKPLVRKQSTMPCQSSFQNQKALWAVCQVL